VLFACLVENALAIQRAPGADFGREAGIHRTEQPLEYRPRVHLHRQRRFRILPRQAVGVSATGARIALPTIRASSQPICREATRVSGAQCRAAIWSNVTPARSQVHGRTRLRAGVTFDQIAARHWAPETRVASLQIGCEDARMVGNCDTGSSCAYTNSLSWKIRKRRCRWR